MVTEQFIYTLTTALNYNRETGYTIEVINALVTRIHELSYMYMEELLNDT